MEVLREYPGSHHYIEDWKKTEYFCPNCGAKDSVWIEQGLGDYYVGPSLACCQCLQSFTMQGPSPAKEPWEIQVIEQLKTGITLKPTTKRGR